MTAPRRADVRWVWALMLGTPTVSGLVAWWTTR